MTPATEPIAAVVKMAQGLHLRIVDASVGQLVALLDAHTGAVDAYGRLAAAVTVLDFDAGEAALPETQEGWLAWLRDAQDRVEKVLDDVGDLA